VTQFQYDIELCHGQAEVSLKKGWIISQILNKMKIISLLASFLTNGMNPETSALN